MKEKEITPFGGVTNAYPESSLLDQAYEESSWKKQQKTTDNSAKQEKAVPVNDTEQSE